MIIRKVSNLVLPCLCVFVSTAVALEPPAQDYVLEFHSARGTTTIAPNDAALLLDNEFTLEAWVRIGEYSCCGVIVGRSRDPQPDSPPWQYALIAYDDQTLSFLQSPGLSGPGTSVDSPPQALDSWIHVAGTLSDGTLTLYVDGVSQGSIASLGDPLTVTDIPISVGNGGLAPDQLCCAFNGAIAEVRVWSRALSAAEILAGAGSKLTGSEQDLVAYWPLDDGQGQMASDLAGDRSLILGTSVADEDEDPRWMLGEILESGPYFSLSSQALSQLGLQDPYAFTELLQMDLDADTDQDLIVAQQGPQEEPATLVPVEVLENDGSGTFFQNTALRLDETLMVTPFRTRAADFDGDGRLDLLIPASGLDIDPYSGEQNRLFLQSQAGKLVDVTVANYPPDPNGFSHGVAVGDYDGDGDLDIFETDVTFGGRILVNDGSGSFQLDVTGLPADVADPFFGAIAVDAGDIDRDGDLDIVVFMGTGSQTVLLNNGKGLFTHAPADTLPPPNLAPDERGLVVRIEDFDLDGWPDLMVSFTNYLESNFLRLLINDRKGHFRELVTAFPADYDPATNVWNFEIADINGDGWLDMAIRGDTKFKIFINKGLAIFEDWSVIGPYVSHLRGYRAVLADFDNDRDIDLTTIDNRELNTYQNIKPFDNFSIPAPPFTDFLTAEQNLITLRRDLNGIESEIISVGAVSETVNFDHAPHKSRWFGRRLEAMPTDTGTPDLALISVNEKNEILLSALDGSTGTTIRKTKLLSPLLVPKSMLYLPEITGQPTIALLAQRVYPNKIVVKLTNPYTGLGMGKFEVLNKNWFGQGMAVLPGLEGSQNPRLAVLANSKGGNVRVSIVDAESGVRERNIDVLNQRWWPVDIQAVDDQNGNDSPEIIVLAQRDDGKIIARMTDTATSELISKVFPFNDKWRPLNFVVLPDVAPNGSPEIAVLGVQETSGVIKVQTIELDSGTVLKSQKYLSPKWHPYKMAIVPSSDDNQIPDIAVLGARIGNGKIRAQIRDGLSGNLIRNVSIH
jgi:hypothetical protein